MKKILIAILTVILFIPYLKADCDYQSEVRLGKLASSITYEYKYDKTHNNFTLTLYNVSDELYIKSLMNHYSFLLMLLLVKINTFLDLNYLL